MDNASVSCEVVVVKRMRWREGVTREDEQRKRELVREKGTRRHANVVSLRGLLRVGRRAPPRLRLQNRGPARVPLEWQTRLKLAQDAAQGLAYLHGMSGGKLAHRHLTSRHRRPRAALHLARALPRPP
uniref:Protein kinase domain-containing protein n=1 Tax=Oryza barthii TaxID=65489 RepID=A0A0D3HK14_9ORYZ